MVKVRSAYSQDKAPLQALGCQTDNGLFSFSKIHVTGGNRTARLTADFSCTVFEQNYFVNNGNTCRAFLLSHLSSTQNLQHYIKCKSITFRFQGESRD